MGKKGPKQPQNQFFLFKILSYQGKCCQPIILQDSLKCNISTAKKKKMNDKVCFWHVDKHKSFLNLYFNTFGITLTSLILSLLMDMIKHSQIAISLQHLKKKKQSGMEFIFDMQRHCKVSTSWYCPFWWKWPDMSKIAKIGSW